uniref:Putative secreted protein n=1 Tax=Anopheles marajoara TaxID=58244 RepID=A0A2M4C790_9DIPT
MRISVSSLGMLLTTLFISSSLICTNRQFSSSVGSRTAPFFVIHGCSLIWGSVMRCCGSLSSMRPIRSRSSSLIVLVGGYSSGSPLIFSYTPGTEVAINGTLPCTSEYSVAPSAQISAALPL